MDVNLLRAVLWAEWERFRGGKKALRIVLAIALLPTTVLSALLGWDFAHELPRLNAMNVGSSVAAGLCVLALLAAIWDGTPALDTRPLRPFQARPLSLFEAELALSLMTPFKLAQGLLLLAFSLGAGAARPLLLGLLPLAVGLLVSLVCLERLLGRLTRLATQHLRLALVFVALVPPCRGRAAQPILSGNEQAPPAGWSQDGPGRGTSLGPPPPVPPRPRSVGSSTRSR